MATEVAFRPRRSHRTLMVLIGAAVAIAVAEAYLLVAAYPEPLAPGNFERLVPTRGAAVISSASSIPGEFSATNPPPLMVLDYVDGAQLLLFKSLANNGHVPMTITAVEADRPDMRGLLIIEGAQPAVMDGPDGGAIPTAVSYNGTNSLPPASIDPGDATLVAVRMVMANCEYNGPGEFEVHDAITVDYTVLGFPHQQKMTIGPYWIQSPAGCPRPRVLGG